MTEPSIRVAIVDDQELMVRGLQMVLDAEHDLEVVGTAGSGLDGVTLADRTRPDVVLMDVRMPGMDGLEATARITASRPLTRVIVLTTFDLDEYAFGGLRAGASGFLLKNTPPRDLVSAIRAVHSGDAIVSPRITRAMLDLFASRLPGTRRSEPEAVDSLTEREREIFLAMAEGLSNSEIASRFFLSESTVKTHVGRVLAKLDLRDRVHAVILAYESGLVGG
ncbi:MAG: Response regulator protein VraR [Actinomycetota bacterium]|jgi:DNA-binding NarL/FixJ family response regulator